MKNISNKFIVVHWQETVASKTIIFQNIHGIYF